MSRKVIIDADINNVLGAELPWEYFYGKTVVITGANGFLPAYMLRTLYALNAQQPSAKIKIVAIVRNRDRFLKQFNDIPGIGEVELVIQDISDPLRYEGPADIIIHAASQASPKFYGTDPVGTLAANTIGTYNLLKFAVSKKVSRFLYFSSSEVYGSVSNQEAIAEQHYGTVDPLHVRSCYAESKRMGETMCISFSAQYSLPVVIVRPFHTYGPGLDLADGRVFSDFVSNVVHGKDIAINSDGSAVRSFCYLSDAAQAFFTVLLKGEPGNAYNVGNPVQSVSIRQLAKEVVSIYPEKGIRANFAAPPATGYISSAFNKLIPDISKLEALGWQPATTIREGFKRTIDSFISV
ncbi:MAG: NAD-dependent epimerase/dehydratase family protein [Chitinophagaceae bacterium]|nr:NAD-dependent epimerase/dehydratase family protein [Chitinophagaceae bacterium]